MAERVLMGALLRLVVLVGLLSSCTLITGDLDGRPCGAGQTCAEGFVCHPLTERCVQPLLVGCSGGGICPSTVDTGDLCPSPGSFIPCGVGQDMSCDMGCRTCEDNGSWSACQVFGGECEIGLLNNCSGCGDDCSILVQGTTGMCTTQRVCGYILCDFGFADADGDRTNGCECEVDCDGKCSGPDGCGGVCPNICVAPDTCGGGGDPVRCGDCEPQCDGRCAGPDMCGGSCPDNCVAPETCGGAGAASVCGCIPSCSGCIGDDGCGTPCDAMCTGPDSCGGGGTSNVCGCCAGWWNCRWPYRIPITMSAASANYPAGYAASLSFNHGAEVAASRSRADGMDVSIVYDNGTSLQELPRVLDPESAWNQSDTLLWFPLQAPLNSGQNSGAYAIYLGRFTNTPAPPANENDVFTYADFFERPDDTDLGAGWSLLEGTSGQIDLVSGGLQFVTTVGTRFARPVAHRDFDPITTEFELRTRITWDRPGADTSYAMLIDVGQSSAMSDPPNEAALSIDGVGVGPSVGYGGFNPGGGFDTGLVVHNGANLSFVDNAAATDLRLRIEGSLSGTTFDIFRNGALVASSEGFQAAVTQLDRVRISTRGHDAPDASDQQRFEYLILREIRRTGTLTLTPGTFETPPCQ